jgi:uncharacterized protein YwqG
MLTREELERRAYAKLSADDSERLLGLCAPSARLVGCHDWDPARSRFGGNPLLPDSVEWPEWRGRTLSFLAQLRLEELPLLAGKPAVGTGLLAFFYDADRQEAWGFNPADRGAWRVIHVQNLATARERTAPPGTLSFAARGIQIAEELTVPDPWEPAFLDEFNAERRAWSEVDGGDVVYDLVTEEVAGLRGDPIHQVFGWPAVIQAPMQLEVQLAANGIYVGNPTGYDDPRVEQLAIGATGWRLLAQFDSDDEVGWMWGDGGRLYFWIWEDALSAGRYESCWCVLQCY